MTIWRRDFGGWQGVREADIRMDLQRASNAARQQKKKPDWHCYFVTAPQA
jgi:hypothetical protein